MPALLSEGICQRIVSACVCLCVFERERASERASVCVCVVLRLRVCACAEAWQSVAGVLCSVGDEVNLYIEVHMRKVGVLVNKPQLQPAPPPPPLTIGPFTPSCTARVSDFQGEGQGLRFRGCCEGSEWRAEG